MLDLRLAAMSAAHRGHANAPAVRWFEMGGGPGRHGGRWCEAAEWPPREAHELRLHLAGEHLSQTPGVDRRSFVSDPDDPVPTLGGAINSGQPIMDGGMWDQRPLDRRADVLRYVTEPLNAPLRLAGPGRVRVSVRSDAPDFDIAAKLVDVHPDGSAWNLSDGILRARHRRGAGETAFVPAGTDAELDVVLNPVGALLARGHSLRLDIAGSNFPCFDVNPQTGAPQGEPGPRRAARIDVVAHGSFVSLTVLPI